MVSGSKQIVKNKKVIKVNNDKDEKKRLSDCISIGMNGECGTRCYIYNQNKCKNVEELTYEDL